MRGILISLRNGLSITRESTAAMDDDDEDEIDALLEFAGLLVSRSHADVSKPTSPLSCWLPLVTPSPLVEGDDGDDGD